MAAPLEYMSPKIPGLGDIKWDKFVSALTDIGYNGHAVIEIEDKAFESSQEDILKAINQSIRYLKQFV
jgi:sugar phosphate isomerase/epimerase